MGTQRLFQKRKREEELYKILGDTAYPGISHCQGSEAEIRSNQIQDCQVETKDMDNDKTIMKKNPPYIKGKTTGRNPTQMTEDIIRTPRNV